MTLLSSPDIFRYMSVRCLFFGLKSPALLDKSSRKLRTGFLGSNTEHDSVLKGVLAGILLTNFYNFFSCCSLISSDILFG